MIRYIKLGGRDGIVDYLYKVIAGQLESGKKVLWLVAGGSAMDVAVETARRLRTIKSGDSLAVSLTDERFGPTGHPDSNWRQLEEKGFYIPGARLLPVLAGKDMSQTAADYADMLNNEIQRADYSVALAGMGADGHIFGIKPGSVAVNTKETIAAYEWDDYARLTPTVNFIKQLSEVALYVTGPEKHAQLDMLEKEVPAAEQPAQLLKQVANVTIFNDYKGEDS